VTSYSTFVVGSEHFDCFKAPEDNKPHLAKKIIYNGRHVSYVTDAGKMHSTRVAPGKWFFGARWGSRMDIVRDAIALGVISKAANAALVKAEEAQRARRATAEAARDVLRYAKEAGLSLTVAQSKSLKRKAKVRKP